jgi:hypothetical protein
MWKVFTRPTSASDFFILIGNLFENEEKIKDPLAQCETKVETEHRMLVVSFAHNVENLITVVAKCVVQKWNSFTSRNSDYYLLLFHAIFLFNGCLGFFRTFHVWKVENREEWLYFSVYILVPLTVTLMLPHRQLLSSQRFFLSLFSWLSIWSLSIIDFLL